MESHRHNQQQADSQAYLLQHAEKFIAFINAAAKKAGGIKNLFQCNGGDRFLLDSKENKDLIEILSDSNFQEAFDHRLRAWELTVKEEAIKTTRAAYRDFYFAPIAAQPNWQTFLDTYPASPEQVTQIKAAFFYWIFQIWINANPTEAGKLQPLLKIINSVKDDNLVCMEFDNNLIEELNNTLTGFFLTYVRSSCKKEDISKQVKNKLIGLEKNYSHYQNITSILWNRIEIFLNNSMLLQTKQLTPKEGESTPTIERSPSKKRSDSSQLTVAVKKAIANGLLQYFYEHKALSDKKERDMNLRSLTPTMNQLFLFTSEEKHKHKYADLFAYVTDDVKTSFYVQKRKAYGSGKPLFFSTSVANLSRTNRSSLTTDDAPPLHSSNSTPQIKRPTFAKDDTDKSLQRINEQYSDIKGNERIPPRKVSREHKKIPSALFSEKPNSPIYKVKAVALAPIETDEVSTPSVKPQ